jgi:crotonobetainyl-CoA:carnitine CoA-transferase CaiB-like acyl-CoA transferase
MSTVPISRAYGSVAHGLLDAMRVLDLSQWRPAPYATQLLADLGAEVLKVEPPGSDPMRAFPEIFATVAGYKRSVVLDLKDPRDRARALELAAEADVVVEGWRPGVAARLGVGPADVRAVNPRVVYCSLSGFGGTGPLAHAPGHDVNYQARAGSLAPDGGEPAPMPQPRIPFADLAGGLAAAFAICAAWIGCRDTGEGETIDVSMTDLLATWTNVVGGGSLEGVERPVRGMPAYGIFPVADGYVALGVIVEQHFFDATCRALGLDDLVGLGLAEQLARGDEVRARIAGALAPWTRDAAVERLLAEGAPISPVLTRAEVVADEHLRIRETVVDGPDGPAFAHPVRFESHPARPPGPSPKPDEHAVEGFSAR